MRHKKPCSICGRWFLPNARVGERQRVCSDPACQKERHRRNCAGWRRSNPDYDREDRLKRKLHKQTLGEAEAPAQCTPMGRIDWQAARDLVGLEVAVLIEETSQVLLESARDLVASKALGMTGESPKVPPRESRDEIGDRPRGP